MSIDFKRVAIVNRGEPAMRLIHAVREMNREAGGALLRTIALFTDPDRASMFVREADEAVPLGPATYLDEKDGQHKSAYLDHERLRRALTACRADAVWVGWGFVAEQAEFADLCRRLGLVFIGPSPEVMRLLGDKIGSKRLAAQVGVPVVPWSDGPVDTVEEALCQAERVGYPLLIKATAGGGGRGIREVRTPAELPDAFARATAEALRAFGDRTVFLEHLLTNVHHVEVQIVADRHGTTWAVGVRDCSLQRRHQKVMEEAPSPALTAAQDSALREAAVRLCQAAGYESAGTVEFLYHPLAQTAYFMEVNARLQVEHPVTEVTTGLDLVKLQLQIARGERLIGRPPSCNGHAIEVRLNAEDPDRDFTPSPGRIDLLRLPTGPGLRVDTGVGEGDTVPAEFDSMLAKIVAWGRNREEALSRLRRGLGQTVVVLSSGITNKAFLCHLLEQDPVQRGAVDNAWLDRMTQTGAHISRRHADVALLQAAIEVYDAESAIDKRRFYSLASRGRPSVRAEAGYTVELRNRCQTYQLRVYRLGPEHYQIGEGTWRLDVLIERRGPFERWLSCGGRRYRLITLTQGPEFLVEVEGIPHRISRDDGGAVHAPSPAMVVEVYVKEGDVVAAGARLMLLEAMKMEIPVVAPVAGRVKRVMTNANMQVDAGVRLLLLDPLEVEDRRSAAEVAERPTFAELRPDAKAQASVSLEERWRRCLNGQRCFLLGFDVDPAEAERLGAEHAALAVLLPPGDASLRAGDEELLAIFADLCSIFRRQPASDDPAGAAVAGAEERLFTFLRMLDSRGEGLPPAFLADLQRALRHYGVSGLERTPQLEESLLRIFKSHQWVDRQAQVILAILERWLADAKILRARGNGPPRALLDRLVRVTNARFQEISEIGREVRFRCFDQPLFEEVRTTIYDEMEVHLARLGAHPNAADRETRMSALVDCPQPLERVLVNRFPNADAAGRALMLEVLTRRYYRIRTIETVTSQQHEAQTHVLTEYPHEGRRIRVVVTHANHEDLREAVASLRGLIASADDVVLDLYVFRAGSVGDADDTASAFAGILSASHLQRPLRRVTVVVIGGDGPDKGGVQHFTYRPTHDGSYREEPLYRDLHPMMGKRVHLWRLRNFDVKRLPSIEDIYLYQSVARTNPKDRRVFAIAEVRDLTPVRDARGQVVQLPYLERMLMETLSAIRQVRSRQPVPERFYGNRVLLYVWPPFDLRPDEINDIVQRLAPATQGLGIEEVLVQVRIPDRETGVLRDTALHISNPRGTGPVIAFGPLPMTPVEPLSEYEQKVLRLRQHGLVYPYEIIRLMAPPQEEAQTQFPPGEFREHDLDEVGRLVPVDRPPGGNTANVVVGVIKNFTDRHPEGMSRVLMLGDPARSMGAVAEAECRRIAAALDLAASMKVPLEWFPLSAGAKISMESGTENMDWVAMVLRRIIEFTQAGGEINVVVNGINVGAQPYWNAEATMLLHTRGILIMTPSGAMVLTGKQALDFSGSVSAEDNQGIGGYERVMGPNGQAQYWARDITDAVGILFRHYEHTYVSPGERFPRPAIVRGSEIDPRERDVRAFPHGEGEFAWVGEIFSADQNPCRKRPFAIRRVMQAVIDQDHAPLERWADMRDAEIAVTWDVHLGGYPVCLLGIESHPLPRLGFLPADGPDHWTAGTLFPRSSKKAARTINAASGNRPMIILANLSGFDGSPESLRELQLEYGAEIGRAVVNFRGPMVFCVVSRYHGGAYVVFSGRLNEGLELAAVEGSFASVIGGAPAAAVVFAGNVEARTRGDARVKELEGRIAAARDPAEAIRLRTQLGALQKAVHAEKLGEVADEFDKTHSVERALRVGSLHHIIPAQRLRPYLIEAVERGIRRCQAGASAPGAGGP